MKKNLIAYIGIWVILLGLFNVIAFVSVGWIGIEKYTPSFWIGYIFISLAFVGQLICSLIAFNAKDIKSLFYNLPLITVSYSGLIASFIIGGLCMLISPLPYWVGILVCAIVLAIYAIAVLEAGAASNIVSETDKKIKTQTEFIKMAIVDAESLVNCAKNDAIKEECKKVYEAIRYSDPMSVSELSVVEAKITVKIDELAAAVGKDDIEKTKEIASMIVLLIKERNNKCKALK